MSSKSVLLEWVENCPWKCQSILLSGLRGTDNSQPPHTKAITRWIRTISQQNADPSKGYMQQDELPTPLELCKELEYQTCHFVHHLADALRVISIWHPEADIKYRSNHYHWTIAEELFHFVPESIEMFTNRHKDKAGPHVI